MTKFHTLCILLHKNVKNANNRVYFVKMEKQAMFKISLKHQKKFGTAIVYVMYVNKNILIKYKRRF